MIMMRIFSRPQLFYVSPWLLAAATGLLVLIVVTFTLNNVQREKYLMKQALIQKADTIIRVVHSGARSSYFSDVRKGIWSTEPWNEYAQRVVDHVAEDPSIKFLAVVNESGTIEIHSNQAEIGGTLDFTLPEIPKGPQPKGPPVISHRIIEKSLEGRTFAAVRLFFPYLSLSRSMSQNRQGRMRRMHKSGGMMLPRRLEEKGRVEEHAGLHKKYFIVVGLDMSAFDDSLRRQKLQGLILSITMLLVGIGGWLSLSAVQGFRISQKTLSEMKAFTGLLVAKLPVGIIATDQQGRITTWNTAASEMTGIREEDASGKQPENILPDEFSVFFTKRDQDMEKIDNRQGREKEISVTLNTKLQNFLCHINAVQDDEMEYKGQVLLISNLTQLKALEKEMREHERLAAVGRMAAGVAHEVRNPLSSIKGLALLLKGKFETDSRESETAALLIQEVERMNRTVSELLSFARPASLELKEVSLKDLLDENIRLVSSDAQSGNVTIDLRAGSNLKSVLADRDRLNQVFINLLLNALQSMDKGGKLSVRAENSESGSSVIIHIRDTGCGIAPENMEQLFYPYFTTKDGGTGIGLAISQKIISDHGGSIKIDSVPDRGTSVTVEMPAYVELNGSSD